MQLPVLVWVQLWLLCAACLTGALTGAGAFTRTTTTGLTSRTCPCCSSSARSLRTPFAGRDQVNPLAGRMNAKDLYAKAGITNPRKEIDCAEIYVPFSWFEPMWMETMGFAEEGQGWKMTYEGATALDGDLPVNMSGGVLSSNPIGASGLIRFAEAAMQVRGQAGEHQVDGVHKALGHAYGGGSQYFSTYIVADHKA